MRQIGLDIYFTTMKVKWYENEMEFDPVNYFKDNAMMRQLLSSDSFRVEQFDAYYEDAKAKY